MKKKVYELAIVDNFICYRGTGNIKYLENIVNLVKNAQKENIEISEETLTLFYNESLQKLIDNYEKRVTK